MRFVWWVGLIVATPGWGHPLLDTARAELKALRYPAADKALKAALATSGFSRAEALEYYELKGLVAGGANRGAEARDAFVALLTLDPEFKLKGKPAPRVTTPFFEARTLVKEQGALGVTVEGAPDAQRVGPVRITVKGSSALVRGLRLELVEGGARREEPLAASGGVVDVRSRRIVIIVRALGERDWVLFESAPTQLESPAPPAPAPGPPPSPPLVERPAPVPEARFRPLAYGLGAGGAAAIVVGIVFGLQARSARELAERGAVTRAEALELAPRAVREATIANVLFIAGGAALAGGVLTFILGLPPSTQVSLVPLEGGAMAMGGLQW